MPSFRYTWVTVTSATFPAIFTAAVVLFKGRATVAGSSLITTKYGDRVLASSAALSDTAPGVIGLNARTDRQASMTAKKPSPVRSLAVKMFRTPVDLSHATIVNHLTSGYLNRSLN